MKGKIAVLMGFFLFVVVSAAQAWVFGVEEFSYKGHSDLRGTVAGQIYTALAGSISNDSLNGEELVVNLNYGNLSGYYQFSPNMGKNWIDINAGLERWTRTLGVGNSILLRFVFTDDSENIYHIMGTSPWGDAQFGGINCDLDGYCDVYYFAFPPASGYYIPGWETDIRGNVAIVVSQP